MTGLPSPYNLISQVERHLEANQTTQDKRPFVFVFFDLDRFKNINDALGHRIGDQFLAALCRRLHGSFAKIRFLQGLEATNSYCFCLISQT